MKSSPRRLCLFLLLLFVALTSAADEGERRRYLVGTEEYAAKMDLPIRGDRTLHSFRQFRGFSALMTEAEAAALALQPGIRFVEPDQERHLLDTRPTVGPGEPVLSAGAQEIPWGIAATNADKVWPVTKGAGVRVGIIDTGIHYAHPDLAMRYKGGRDFENNDDDPRDDNGHGTHVAGTIGATDNDFGVVGIAPEVDLYALKVLDADGGGSTFNLLRAVEWAIDPNGDDDTSDHLDVINMSLGGGGFSALEKEAFDKAFALGMISVAASGNNFPTNATIDYPARYDSVIAVGAIDESRLIASFSQRGTQMELVGAGVSVLSTVFLGSAYRIEVPGIDAITGQPMEHSPQPNSASGTIVSSGVGNPEDFPSGTSGNIALIQRGELSFKDKSENAKAAGAVAAIIYNNAPGDFAGTLCSLEPCIFPNIPFDPLLTVSVSQEDGILLTARDGASAMMTFGSASGYGLNQGTSMAAPHVAGVAALLGALNPEVSAQQIRDAMSSFAVDLGTVGFDTTYGNGMIDAYGAGKALAPWRFGVENPARRRSVRRSSGGS